MGRKESQGPVSRSVPSQRADEKRGRSPGEPSAKAHLRLDVPTLPAAEVWQQALDAAPDPIAILDTRHRVVWANQAMADRLGLAKEQCVGQTC
jgi:PAS domain-containing protein